MLLAVISITIPAKLSIRLIEQQALKSAATSQKFHINNAHAQNYRRERTQRRQRWVATLSYSFIYEGESAGGRRPGAAVTYANLVSAHFLRRQSPRIRYRFRQLFDNISTPGRTLSCWPRLWSWCFFWPFCVARNLNLICVDTGHLHNQVFLSFATVIY